MVYVLQVCDCFDRNVLNKTLKVVGYEVRSYKYGPGVKIDLKAQDEHVYHTVIFANSPFYGFLEDIQVNEYCIGEGGSYRIW